MTTIDTFQQALRLLAQEVKRDINFEHIRMLIELMTNHPEPLSVAHMAEAIGTHVGRIRQHCELLGEKIVEDPTTKASKNIGLGLVVIKPDAYESEKEVLALTKKALNLKARLVEVLS
jgi:methionine synthase II (cobalamin-independent)